MAKVHSQEEKRNFVSSYALISDEFDSTAFRFCINMKVSQQQSIHTDVRVIRRKL